jgi:hypothetical protein
MPLFTMLSKAPIDPSQLLTRRVATSGRGHAHQASRRTSVVNCRSAPLSGAAGRRHIHLNINGYLLPDRILVDQD